MSSIEEFQQCATREYGIEVEPHEFPEGTKTARDAAEALGCDVREIASSIVLVADEPVVVVISGPDHVDTRALATVRNVHEARLAEPDEVEDATGYPVGAVPPFCHETDVPVYVDEAVTEHEQVWVAAGSSDAVFPIDPETLVECADATVVDVAK